MTVVQGQDIINYHDDAGNQVIGNGYVTDWARIEFQSSHCRVKLGAHAKLQGTISLRGPRGLFELKNGALFRGRAELGNDSSISLGHRMYCGTDLLMSTAEGQRIAIGDDCLISDHVRIRADDSHPIFDARTGRRVNPSRSIIIGHHVWIGLEVIALPGSTVGSGAVVGARAVLTHATPVPENSVAVGSPASIVRQHIKWIRKHLQSDVIPSDIEPGYWDGSSIHPQKPPSVWLRILHPFG